MLLLDCARGLSFAVSLILWLPNWIICEVCSVWVYFLGQNCCNLVSCVFLSRTVCYFLEDLVLFVAWPLTGGFSGFDYVVAGGQILGPYSARAPAMHQAGQWSGEEALCYLFAI